MNYSKLYHQTKKQLQNYISDKTINLSNSQRRTFEEMCYGILHTGDVLLTDIARSLNERSTLNKVVERLSKNLSKSDFSDTVESKHLKDLAPQVDDDTLIVIDGSHLDKPRAKTMEGLCPYYDTTTEQSRMGYYLDYSCIVSADRTNIKSALTRLYSTKQDGFLSQNDECEKMLSSLFTAFNNKGIFLADRWYSKASILRYFDNKRKYVIRGNERTIKYKGDKYSLTEWAKSRRLIYAMVIEKVNEKVKYDVCFNCYSISTEGLDLTAVVLRLDDHEPCILFTNQDRGDKSIYDLGKMVIEQYGCRWSVEEKIRFEKQQMNYQNFRVRNLTALKNLMVIVNILSSFISLFSFKEIAIKVIEVANCIKEQVRFEYYRITEGIKKIFRMRNKAPFEYKHPSNYFHRSRQLQLWEVLW